MNKKRDKAEGFLHLIPEEDVLMSTFHLDFIGPFSSTNKHYNHNIVELDTFTKFMRSYPM